MTLHLWHDEDVEIRIGGDAAILRSTFFGELVLTPRSLADALEGALGPLKRRWDPSAHVPVEVEHELRRALLEPGSWALFRDHGTRMLARCLEIEAHLATMAGEDAGVSRSLVGDLRVLGARLVAIADGADDGDPAAAVQACRASVELGATPWSVRQLGTRLRGRRHPAAVWIAAAEADKADALAMLIQAAEAVSSLAFAVVADAGEGKSYLSAQLAAPTDGRPAGVLMLGIDLAAGQELNHLVRRAPALRASSFHDLVAALDATAAREGRRLPIVIDGLNESERPNSWETILAQAKPVLERFPNVLLVVTLRESIARDVLPDYMHRLDLRGFQEDVDTAVRKYFDHYKIEPGAVRLPLGQFEHPLFLRLYCEAANPTRSEVVGPEALPSSLVEVYRRYKEVAADRLRRRLSLGPGYVEGALDRVAWALWDSGTRSLPFSQLRTIVGDDAKEWETSLARALEEEGLLWRSTVEGDTEERTALLFDPFAGFLIADALARGGAAGSPIESLRSGSWNSRLFDVGKSRAAHQLASDIRSALLDALPRHTGVHLWQEAPEEYRNRAIDGLLWVAPELLDRESINQVERRLREMDPPESYFRRLHRFDRLEELLDAHDHPFNAEFTSRVLASYVVSRRDRLWSEWLRTRYGSIVNELARTEAQLRRGELSPESARLRAVWTAWLLTSTVAPIRDLATRWLYWYGRSTPGGLFDLVLKAAFYNDPYPLERLAGAAYGVVMAAYGNWATGFEDALNPYLRAVEERFVGDAASAPTTNHVVRGHLTNTVALACLAFPAAVPTTLASAVIAFSTPEPPRPQDGIVDEVDETLHMDFVNYTMGGVFEDRANYQRDHPGHIDLVQAVKARIGELGWTTEAFGGIDRRITEDRYRPWSRQAPGTERYGKKYGWIAFHEEFGRLVANGAERLSHIERLPDTGPDISFPEPPEILAAGAGARLFDHRVGEDWVRSGETVLPEALLPTLSVDGRMMITIDAHLSTEDAETERRLWIRVRVFLVDAQHAEAAISALRDVEYLGNALLFDPADYYLYAGEIPWHPSFGRDVAYARDLRTPAGHTFELDDLVHEYSFEGRSEWLQSVSQTSIAAAPIWATLGLRIKPQTFDGRTADGQCLAAVRAAPDADRSSILYIDEKALRAYAAHRGKTIVRVAFGERQIAGSRPDLPGWYERARQERADEWRTVEVV